MMCKNASHTCFCEFRVLKDRVLQTRLGKPVPERLSRDIMKDSAASGGDIEIQAVVNGREDGRQLTRNGDAY
eukprot:3095670-Pleurochrysis_carterae.AAC.5